MKTEEAVNTLKKAFKNDPDFAHTWHCNIAMACYDSIEPCTAGHEERLYIGNQAASRFMKLAFDVVTEKEMLSL